MKHVLIFAALILVFASCGETVYFSNEMNTEDGIWKYDRVFENEFTVSDTSRRFDLVLDIQHSRDYSFQNVYMNISTHFPGDSQVVDLLSVDLADRSGKWYGNCRGDYCNLRVYLQQNVGFKDPGTYKVNFEQYTRRPELSGLATLSFKILPR
nr:gliding motility lipoprotein GldH [Saprospiraceae bacterium]